MTRRQLTHWQRESRLQRFTIIGGILILLVVVVLVGTGVFTSKVAPMRETVLKITNTDAADTEYSFAYYEDALSYIGASNFTYMSSYMTYSSFLEYISGSVVSQIEQNYFLKEAAAMLDSTLTVSDQEIDSYIQEKSVSPVNQAVRDFIYASLLDTKLKDYFDKKVPASAEQRAVWAMFLESQSQVENVKAQLANGAAFNELAGQLSSESTSKSKNGDFGFVPQGVLSSTLGNKTNTTLDNLVFSPDTKINVLTQAEDKDQSKRVGYWLIRISKATEDSTATPTPTASPEATPTPKYHVQAMLLGSQIEAEQIKAQLEGGADFATLAKANSQYSNATTDGGDLGNLSKDDVTSKLGSTVAGLIFPEDSAAALPLDTINGPYQDTNQTTKGGFWLVQVTGIEEKAGEGANRDTLVTNLKTDWTDKVWADNQSRGSNLLTSEQTTSAIAEAVSRGY